MAGTHRRAIHPLRRAQRSPLPQGMVSLATSPARSDARVQHVGLQFGKGSGMHLRFVCAARECLAMKRTTFPPVCLSHGTSWSCLTDQSQQRERQLRTAPATHRLLVRLAERLRSITSASKRGIERHDQSSHKPDLARGGASGGGASCAEMPLRTEGVASFAEVSCATRSNFDSSATKPGTW
jgi:hypothetical protein